MLREDNHRPEFAGVLSWQWLQLCEGYHVAASLLHNRKVLRLDAQGIHPVSSQMQCDAEAVPTAEATHQVRGDTL